MQLKTQRLEFLKFSTWFDQHEVNLACRKKLSGKKTSRLLGEQKEPKLGS